MVPRARIIRGTVGLERITRRSGPAMNNHIARCTIVLAILIGLVVPAHAQRRPITDKDLFAFVWVADPQISPDGSQVAFVRVTVDEKKDAYDTGHLAREGGRQRAAARDHGRHARHQPALVARRPPAGVRPLRRKGRPAAAGADPRAWRWSGGEPWAITDIPRGAANPEWAPDGKTIAFSSTARPADLDGGARSRQPTSRAKPTCASSPKPSIAPTASRAAATSTAIARPRSGPCRSRRTPARRRRRSAVTSGEFAAANHRWSPDGTRIFFVSDRRRESYYYARDSDLYSIARDGGEPARVASIDGTIGAYALSPDGKRVAFVGTPAGDPERSYTQPDLWVAELGSGTPRNLTATYDFDINGGIGGDQRAPRGQLPSGPVWTRDGRTILVGAGEQGNANLKRVDAATGKIDSVTTGNHDVMSYTADAGGQKFAVVLSTPTVLGDLHVLDAASPAAPKQLTTFNDALFGQLTHERAGRAVVHELRRPEDSGLDPQAAGVRGGEEVSAHPPDPRRPALRLRQHVHARVPVDGRQGLRRPLHEPARQLELRAGLRQHHPVQLPGRRLQGSDGRRRRDPEEGVHRRDAAGRHRRQRRRAADQLGRDPDHPLQGRGAASATSRTGRTSGTRPTSRSSHRRGSGKRRSRIPRTSRSARRLRTWPRSRRR